MNPELQEQINDLKCSIRELCNLVMILQDNSTDEALKKRANQLVMQSWNRIK